MHSLRLPTSKLHKAGAITAAGPDIAIMVDYNQSLTPADAVERLRHVDDEGLTWIEEPTLAHDYQGHAHITRETHTPIQCGETGGACATCSMPSKPARAIT